MPFTPKNWEDSPSVATPLSAAALEDMETRLSDYTGELEDNLAAEVYAASYMTWDGTTDDTAGFVSAIAATSGGKTLVLPEGTALVDGSALLLLDNVTVRGQGRASIVKVKNGVTPGAGIFQVTNKTGVWFRDFTIDLNKANTTDPAVDTSGQAIYFIASNTTGITDCGVDNVIVKDGHRIGIYSTNSDASVNPSEVTVRNCKITGCVKRGIFAVRPTDVIIRHNRLSGNCTSDSGGGQIQVTNGAANTAALIEGNRCVGSGNDSHGIACSFAENIQIIGNRCNSNGGSGSNGWGIVISEGVDDFEVIGNRCKANRIGGITVDVRVGATTDIRDANGVVSGNVCSGAVVSHGIYHQFGTGLAIANNVCYGNAHSGIMVADAQRTQIYGNTCHTNTQYGITFTQSVIATAGDHWLGSNNVYSNTTANYDGLAHGDLGNPVGRFDRDDGQAGMLVPSTPTWTTFTLVASRGTVIRFVPSRTMTVASIAFAVVTAAGADDAVDVGIYDSAFAKLVSKGATTGLLNAVGVKNVDITDTVLNAGEVYYAAISVGTFGGSSAAVVGHNFVQDRACQLFGTTAGLVLNGFDATGHPLDTTFVSAGAVASHPVLALREA